MEKRGFSALFNWVFGLIAGMIIFLFLINFAYKHIYLSESKTSSIILSEINFQLDSISSAEDLDTSIESPKKISFDCGQISLESSKISTEKIIFSDNKENNLQVWTKTWYYPFAIENFYYITDKTYYFFSEPYDLYSKIPERFNILAYPDPVPEGSILIFFRQPSQSELLQYKTHKIKIVDNSKVTFYPDKIIDALGEEMLLGAIFTDNFSKFECLKEKAINKLKLVTDVYIKKAQTLSNIKCPDQYNLMISQLNQFKSSPINPETIENLDKELERNDCTPLFQ